MSETEWPLPCFPFELPEAGSCQPRHRGTIHDFWAATVSPVSAVITIPPIFKGYYMESIPHRSLRAENIPESYYMGLLHVTISEGRKEMPDQA